MLICNLKLISILIVTVSSVLSPFIVVIINKFYAVLLLSLLFLFIYIYIYISRLLCVYVNVFFVSSTVLCHHYLIFLLGILQATFPLLRVYTLIISS